MSYHLGHSETCPSPNCILVDGHEGPHRRSTLTVKEIDDLITLHGRHDAFAAGMLLASRMCAHRGAYGTAKIIRDIAVVILGRNP